ncbi:Transcription factor, fungi [Penicillium roqueforti FM164]|uniref:Transcription factor, fungi n=1 Tax=Penicillium roqueforti (strain FM164) TaxID=1365484 RepID=W6QPY6_PENRF|nr:Transcription factor, fungi [Penicillium roqueforti FM164]
MGNSGMKNQEKHPCQHPGCSKSFTRAEHLRRHALNHEQARNGYTCERCSVHFQRSDLLARHVERHQKRDLEAGGPGQGTLKTRKRTRRAEDGSIVVRPSQRQLRTAAAARSPISANSTSQEPELRDEVEYFNDNVPLSPPGSGTDPTSISMDDTDPFLASLVPAGPFEQYVEPVPGQFDAADGSFGVELDGIGDYFGMDTATDFNLPFAATSNYNWLFDVSSLDDAFHQFNLPLGFDTAPILEQFDSNSAEGPEKYDGPSALLMASIMDRGETFGETASPAVPSLPDLDWMSGAATLDPNPPMNLPTISEEARKGILALVAQAHPTSMDGNPMVLDSPLLTLPALQAYCDMFFDRFNTTYPLIHQHTFDPSTAPPVFLASIIFMGATYGTREAHQLAVEVHDVLRSQLLCHPDFSPQADLWVLQTMLLIDCFGKMRAGPKQRERAQLFHCVLIKMIRRSNCCGIRDLSNVNQSGDLDQMWRQAMEEEQRKRVAIHCFMWDTQHAVLFSQSLCMSAFEIRSSLPCGPAVWDASSAREWSQHAFREENRQFLTVLKGYITPAAVARPRDLNVFARIVVLHGLMSVSADLKRRDQTTLRSETPERVGAWTPRMGRSYDLWKVDFDADCLAIKLAQTASPRQFTGLKISGYALYHAAYLALNVEVLDLQIVAGACQILGRTVTEADQARSLRNITRWLQEESGPSCSTARQAASLLQDAVLSLHDWDQADSFHFPWCLYLCTLACWVFHRGPNLTSDDNRTNTDLSSLIVMLTNCPSLPELAVLSGKYCPRPLAGAMAKQLATVRWAVVHDAMKVLMRLS